MAGEAAPPQPDSDTGRYLERLRTERGYSPRTLAAYHADLDILSAIARERSAEVGRGRPAPATSEPSAPAVPGHPAEVTAKLADHPSGSVDWEQMDERAVRAWVARASRDGLSARSIARRLSAWRGFFDWLAGQGRLAGNPIRAVRAPRLPRRLPAALAPDQAVRLVDDPQAEGFEALRDRAMYELLYSSGLRVSELVGLDVRHFGSAAGQPRSTSWLSLDQFEVTVTGKGAKRRSVPVGRQAHAALSDWISERERFLALNALSDQRALFLSSRGGRLSVRSVQTRLKRRGIVCGVPASVHPHMLRHSFASHLLQSSGDLRAVQELLGHASIASTQIYTALDFQRLAAVYDAAHPRARRPDPGGDRRTESAAPPSAAALSSAAAPSSSAAPPRSPRGRR